MVRTGIPVSVWEREEPAVMMTAFDLLSKADSDNAGGQADVLIGGGTHG